MVDTIFTSSKEFKPPEACQNLQHNPFAADVFALGLVILSLFVGKNLGEADFAVINQEISLINNVDIKNMLPKMLDIDPEKRETIEKISLIDRGTTVVL